MESNRGMVGHFLNILVVLNFPLKYAWRITIRVAIVVGFLLNLLPNIEKIKNKIEDDKTIQIIYKNDLKLGRFYIIILFSIISLSKNTFSTKSSGLNVTVPNII